MTPSEVVVDKRLYRLGRRVGKGGEGIVFVIGDDGKYAVKLYTTKDSASKETKIAAMVRAELAGLTPLVAFPISIARAKDGSFVGFVMKLINDHKPLHDLYSPGSRKHHFPQADYRFLVRAATNFARAVASVHLSKCVIGDINHSGILVSPNATVSLIDADSFQFSESNQRFLCVVGVPEYTPPELQGKSLAGIVRTPNHDAFGMAVVIFQLLFMGRHPFVGTVRRGDIPPLHENIQHFRYVYADNRNVGMDQPPGTPSLSDFSPALSALFDAAFSSGTVDRRPTAEQWVKQLEALEASLARCQENSLHFAPRDASECAWCEMERQLGTFLFLPYIPQSELRVARFDPGAGGFNLDLIWAEIESIAREIPQAPTPQIAATEVKPSVQATNARNTSLAKEPIGYIFVVAAVVALFAMPALWIIWLPLALWAYPKEKSPKAINPTPFSHAYIDAETRWNKALQEWSLRTGYDDFLTLKAKLIDARDSYRGLAEEERSLRAKYHSERRARQLHAYLDKFDIQYAAVRGIGPGKQATLASYGIDTAADINKQKLLSVPGFGPATSQGLLEWRAKLEQRFDYKKQENSTDQQELTRIRSVIEAKAAPLRRELSAGRHNIQLIVRRFLQSNVKIDPVLIQVQHQREQAACDLAFLGIPKPNIPTLSPSARTPVRSGHTTSSTVQGSYTGGGSSTPICPRCGSAMVKRQARRGRNAGGQFFGCVRYPSCKGTRNI